MPLFVKPLRMDASIGIDGQFPGPQRQRDDGARPGASTTRSRTRPWSRNTSRAANSTSASSAIDDPLAFPPIEMDFSRLPDGKPHILDARRNGRRTAPSTRGPKRCWPSCPMSCGPGLQKAALDAYRALRVRDYGRIDLRLTEDRRDLRHRGQRQLLPGRDQRIRHAPPASLGTGLSCTHRAASSGALR